MLPWLVAPRQVPHHDMPQYGLTALPAATPQKKLTGFWISTDKAGKSAEDGQVRKTNAGEYQECRSDLFPILAQTDHCFMQTNA